MSGIEVPDQAECVPVVSFISKSLWIYYGYLIREDWMIEHNIISIPECEIKCFFLVFELFCKVYLDQERVTIFPIRIPVLCVE